MVAERGTKPVIGELEHLLESPSGGETPHTGAGDGY